MLVPEIDGKKYFRKNENERFSLINLWVEVKKILLNDKMCREPSGHSAGNQVLASCYAGKAWQFLNQRTHGAREILFDFSIKFSMYQITILKNNRWNSSKI